MNHSTWTLRSSAVVTELDPIHLGSRVAARYRLYNPIQYTGNTEVDERLSTYEVAIAVPEDRSPMEVPVLVGLEAIATPYQRCGYLVPFLLDRGIACVLFETPLSGTRSLAPHAVRNLAGQLAPLAERGVDLSVDFMGQLMAGVESDYQQVRALATERHHLEHARTGKRFALFGISLGCLLSSYAFMHGGHGQRLLGVVGHADAATFARGFAGEIARYLGGLSVSNLLSSPAFQMLRPVVERQFGRDGLGALFFLRLLHTLGNGGASTDAINPIRYASQVGPNRRVRFLVGEKDGVARVDDARACTAQVPDGACVVKNCLAHGYVQCGPPYEEVVTSYFDAELGDWQD